MTGLKSGAFMTGEESGDGVSGRRDGLKLKDFRIFRESDE